jgi:hypothetical protein
MNERIKQLAIESHNPYSNFDHEKFAELIIKDVFNIMNDQKNYNRCTYTSHDLDKAKCVVQELIKCINENFKN